DRFGPVPDVGGPPGLERRVRGVDDGADLLIAGGGELVENVPRGWVRGLELRAHSDSFLSGPQSSSCFCSSAALSRAHGPKASRRPTARSGDRELPLQSADLVDEEQNRSVLELRLQVIGFLVTEAESAEDLAQLVSRFVVPVGDEVVEIADVSADTLTDEAVGALLVVGEQMQGLLRHALRRQPVQSVEHADVVLEGLHGRLLGLSVHDLPPLRVDVLLPPGPVTLAGADRSQNPS